MQKDEFEVVDEHENQTALSIVENIDSNVITGQLEAIQNFQNLIRSQFNQGCDFGIIPNTKKPTLLKPGAEKIVMLMGLTTEFEMIDSTRDFEKGFFQYYVKCKFYKDGNLITEGVGTANTKESKYVKGNAYTLDNTVLKMAKKRALVDGALMVGSLSNIFTQDIEDMDLNGQKASNSRTVYTDRDGIISDAQAKRLYAMAKGNNEILGTILGHYNYTDTRQIKKVDFNQIQDEIEETMKKLG